MSWRHIAWGATGLAMAAGGWFAFEMWGAVLLLGAIAVAFVLGWKYGADHAWPAMALGGLALAGVLAWAAATGARCPEPGEKMFIKNNKPPVTCADMRASYVTMATLFGLLGLAGIGWGVAGRRRDVAPPPRPTYT
jgi:hypothetical protein